MFSLKSFVNKHLLALPLFFFFFGNMLLFSVVLNVLFGVVPLCSVSHCSMNCFEVSLQS